MLCFEAILDVLVQFLIATSGFRCVKVAATNDMKIRGCKVQRVADDVEVTNGNKLLRLCQQAVLSKGSCESTKRNDLTFMV